MAKSHQPRLYNQFGKALTTSMLNPSILKRRILVVLFLLSACSPFSTQTNPTATTVLPVPSEAVSPLILSVTPLPSADEVLSRITEPQWDTLWLLGKRVDIEKNEIVYLNGWLSREGYGTLVLSEPLHQNVEAEQIGGLPVAYQILSNGEEIFSTSDWQRRKIGGAWEVHPFERADPFFALFFHLEVISEGNWQVIGKSQVAGREADVLQSDRQRVWVDAQRGVVLRLEMLAAPHSQQISRFIQVEEIRFDIPIPARSRQIVLQEGYSPGLDEHPAGKVDSLSGQPLEFHYLTRDVNNPASGYWIDIYSASGFLGTLDIGSAGFYCGRSADGNRFAYIYQPPGGVETELRWVDLRRMDLVNRLQTVQNPSAPVWSPVQNAIAITGFLKDQKERSTFVVDTHSGNIQKLGEGSLLPPAWSDEGNTIYSLDERYQNLLAFDLSGTLIGKWKFNPENWQVLENNAPLNAEQVRQKFPREGVDYLTRCRMP